MAYSNPTFHLIPRPLSSSETFRLGGLLQIHPTNLPRTSPAPLHQKILVLAPKDIRVSERRDGAASPQPIVRSFLFPFRDENDTNFCLKDYPFYMTS